MADRPTSKRSRITDFGRSSEAGLPRGSNLDLNSKIPTEDGAGVVLQFTEAGVRLIYTLGYPLGLMATGERFGAMALTDWLVERGEPVALPFMDRENVGFRFLPDGDVRVGTRGGVDLGASGGGPRACFTCAWTASRW